jgi:hypothetical protein
VRILLDQGIPVPLRAILAGHEVSTAYELGWSTLSNGELLLAAETRFELFVTTDQSPRYQQNFTGRRLSILVLPTTKRAQIREHADAIQRETISLAPGDYRELTW